jgi:glucose-6-phosphate-specific signal transduction histidine kinase
VDVATDLSDRLVVRCTTALDQLRDVATSVFPATLAARGLPDAVRAHLRRRGIDARLHLPPDGLARYPLPVEVAAYHFSTEALRAVRRDAAHPPTLRISAPDEVLEIAVEGWVVDAEDGQVAGADLQSITDRVAALGGTLDSRSYGTSMTITGRFPVRPLEPVVPDQPLQQGSAHPG